MEVVRRPLMGLMLCFMAGTWCGLYSGLRPALLAGIAACLLVLSAWAVWVRWRGLAGNKEKPASPAPVLGIAACVFVLACLNARVAVEVDALGCKLCGAAAVGPSGFARYTIEGIVTGDVVPLRPTGQGQGRWRVPLRLERAKQKGASWMPAHGRVKVLWHGPSPQDSEAPDVLSVPRYGQRWRMLAGLRRFGEVPRSVVVAWADWDRSWLKSDGHGSRFFACCHTARRSAAARLAMGIEDRPRLVGILQALLLGYRTRLEPAVKDLFVATGTLHVFAISGLHVGMIAGIIIFVLTVCRVPRTRWILFVGPLLVAYTCATGMKTSAVRACLMAIVYFAAPFLGRREDGFSALAFAAVVILLVSPQQLVSIGFMLSFTVVTGLLTLYPLFEARLRARSRPDPMRIEPPGLGERVRRALLFRVGALALLSCAAWLMSAPLTALFFQRFSPIALACNVFVVPMAFLIVLSGCLSLTLGACLDIVAEIFNHASLALIHALVRGMTLMRGVPYGSVSVPAPPCWGVAAWYAGLVCLMVWLKRVPEPDAREG